MARLLIGCFIVFALASPALGIAEDKNWGDKQTREGKQASPKLKAKAGKFQLEKEKIAPMRSKRR